MSQPTPPTLPHAPALINPPPAVTAALHQLQAACGGWSPTTNPPPGSDLWTPEAMACSLSTAAGFAQWEVSTISVSVGATVVVLFLVYMLWKLARLTFNIVRSVIRELRERRAERLAEQGELP